ncbi:microtubule-associated protein Jupiter-like [Chrysoperla carnea]|uniref:microtubule-associated protein Jupiter-like n=1 Tax=Chrysoperla carnea TaxID=189513 RepID=UPI001D060BA3|nr:microtubule-associated protein Jupiter-like [Chrysoperla carnea]
MATYAAYRHIELDNVGYSKKRVRNPPSDIFGGTSSPMPSSPSSQTSYGNNITPLRDQRMNHHRLSDSFTRLFGAPDTPSAPAQPAKVERRSSLGRNPVTGDGVQSWDSPKTSRATTPRILRNPVTGEGVNGPVNHHSPSPKPNGHISAIINGTA